ncbi:Tf2-9, partial [Mucuna pruriens]
MRGKRANNEWKDQEKSGKRKESLLVGLREVRKVRMQDLLEEFQDMFPKDVSHGLPPLRGIEHHIDLTLGATLPNRIAYRISPEKAKEIQKQANNITIRYRHLIPCLDDLLEKLHGSNIFFSKIDLRSKYHQIRVREGDEWKTTFKT